ncbi:hypothetical protein LX97_01872 [Nonlabens dokdonensis]|uniref:Secreted protein n=2 Tax=Nonlabens dokdonensis TaxID=328515 RepID=L7WA91_NONDD|nr:hypothetical protein [Nonlabens dokdonensis]AGC77132.1 hypothetical protein DDD_2005 [Nonlabens dokdonensis DSW-6]PZX41091.1 hypothetical protein LX97_01872 [Nonlabens dokdonensis]
MSLNIKYNLVFSLILLTSFISIAQSSFSNGYQTGYKKGHCYQIYGCIAPIPPISPLPTINESSNSYEDGYQRGFLDGKNSQKSNSDNFTQYTPRKYGDPIEVYDFDLLSASMQQKQQQYRNQQQKLYDYYSKKIIEVRNHSFEYYDNCLEYIKQFQGYYKESKLHRKQIEILNPQLIIDQYPDNVPFKQVEELIKKLQNNERKLKEIILNVEEISKWYLSSPNEIVNGVYSVGQIKDFQYNSNTGDFEQLNTLNGTSYISFSKNLIKYKRNDSAIAIGGFLRFEGIKNDLYVFTDGWDNTLALNKDFSTILIYYGREVNSTQYLKKAIYKNLQKIEQ